MKRAHFFTKSTLVKADDVIWKKYQLTNEDMEILMNEETF